MSEPLALTDYLTQVRAAAVLKYTVQPFFLPHSHQEQPTDRPRAPRPRGDGRATGANTAPCSATTRRRRLFPS